MLFETQELVAQLVIGLTLAKAREKIVIPVIC